jgi:hypothetical protein
MRRPLEATVLLHHPAGSMRGKCIRNATQLLASLLSIS